MLKNPMLNVSHSTLYAISGTVWMLIGIMLLNKGLGFLMHGFQGHSFVSEGYTEYFFWLASCIRGPENAAILLVVLALLVGFVKGRMVLQKAALKSYDRISTLPNPTSIFNLYSRSNLLVIAVMMSLGMLMGLLGVSYDVRGMVDTAVGCALMQGALAYFQLMARVKTQSSP